MIVTIPTVLNSLEDAKRTTFQNSVNSAADWLEKQYVLSLVDKENANNDFIEWCYNLQSNNGCSGDGSREYDLFFEAEWVGRMMDIVGVNLKNYTHGKLWINQETRRACLKLFVDARPSSESTFKGVTSKTDASGNVINGVFTSEPNEIYMQSSGCE